MSKGLGRIQRALLDTLADGEGHTAIEVACLVYGVEPKADGTRYCTDAQYAAVRRALCGLKRLGYVDDKWMGMGTRRRGWFRYGEGACCKWPRRSLDELAAGIAAATKGAAAKDKAYGPPTLAEAHPPGAIGMCECGGWIFLWDAKFCAQCGQPIVWSEGSSVIAE
jgi:hypothetical protein